MGITTLPTSPGERSSPVYRSSFTILPMFIFNSFAYRLVYSSLHLYVHVHVFPHSLFPSLTSFLPPSLPPSLPQVAQNHEVNKMTCLNLAIVLGPNLVWSTNEIATLAALGEINNFTFLLINNCSDIFEHKPA